MRSAKKFFITGCYGASLGAVVGMAIWSLSLLFPIPPDGDFRSTKAYNKAVAYNRLGRFDTNLNTMQQAKRTYEQAAAMDPYYIEATSYHSSYIDGINAYRATKPSSEIMTGIIYGQIQVGHREAAQKTFDLIGDVDSRIDVLFLLVQKVRSLGTGEREEELAKKTIDFVHANIPSKEDENKRDLMFIVGLRYSRLGDGEKALQSFNQAARLYTIVEQKEKAEQEKDGPDSNKKDMLVSASYDRAEDKKFYTGKTILFPLLFGSLGFIFSIILRPALEAFGKAILAPSIAKILKSEEMLTELEKKNG